MTGMGDFSTHINQTTRVIEGLDGWGHGWVYDPYLLAGHPMGTIFDADNKGWEIFVWLGTKIGWSEVQGHNYFVVLTHLVVPWVVLFAARAFEVHRGGTLVAVALGTGLWFFDSFVHWCWWAGMVAYDLGAVLFLVPLACFWRFFQTRRAAWGVASAITLGVAHLVHPYVFFMLVAPMLAVFWRAWPDLGRRDRAWVFGIAGFTLAMNAWWIHNAALFWHYILDSAYYGQSGLRFLATDYASLLINGETTGMLGTRTGFRFMAWVLGGIAIWRWRDTKDPRALPLGAGMLFMLGLSYVGGYFQATQQIQPYRFVMPAAFLATIPAGHFVAEAVGELRRSGLRSPVAWLALAVSVTAGQSLVRDVYYFTPDWLPTVARTFDGHESPIGATGFITPTTYRYGLVRPDDELHDFVRDNDDGQSRWLVDIAYYGEEIAWQSDAQVLGGFTHRNVEHSWANFFRRRPQGIAAHEELRAYFETYAVGWVVVVGTESWLYRVPNPELELVAMVGSVKIFKTKIQPNLVASGGGRVEASTNRLAVTGSDPQRPVRLRFHWMETLRCAPDCTIERVEIDGVDPVGFIEVPAPHPADFVIENSYRFD